MSRIDVQTLILAFERRIEALEKNPPDKVPTSVIINMLEKSIDQIIKDHFLSIVMREIESLIKEEFKNMKNKFIKYTVKNILTDSKFREKLEDKIKNNILANI